MPSRIFPVKVPEGMLALWKAHVKRKGLPLAQFIREAVNEKIQRDR